MGVDIDVETLWEGLRGLCRAWKGRNGMKRELGQTKADGFDHITIYHETRLVFTGGLNEDGLPEVKVKHFFDCNTVKVTLLNEGWSIEKAKELVMQGKLDEIKALYSLDLESTSTQYYIYCMVANMRTLRNELTEAFAKKQDNRSRYTKKKFHEELTSMVKTLAGDKKNEPQWRELLCWARNEFRF